MSTHWKSIHFGAVLLLLLASCSSVAKPDPNAIKPSKPGGTGEALKLIGLPEQGEAIFNSKCKECHGEAGQGGILNPGVESGEVPALNPIDLSLYNSDAKVFAANIDLFIEHGSVPKGTPHRIMLAYGDYDLLTPQQIADVIAYIISLNRP
jgi:mono/diheme cytochrome c family protein